jgi:hypothetical protein
MPEIRASLVGRGHKMPRQVLGTAPEPHSRPRLTSLCPGEVPKTRRSFLWLLPTCIPGEAKNELPKLPLRGTLGLIGEWQQGCGGHNAIDMDLLNLYTRLAVIS